MNIYNDVNLNAKYITNVGKLAYASGLSSEFIKANGNLDRNRYLTSFSSVITDLQNKTQNIVASSVLNTIRKSSQFKISSSNNPRGRTWLNGLNI